MLFDRVCSSPLLCVQTSSSACQVRLSVHVVTIWCQLQTSLCIVHYVADHPASYILSTWVKWPQYEAGAKIKNEWSHTTISSYVFAADAQTVRSLALLATNGCQMSGVGGVGGDGGVLT